MTRRRFLLMLLGAGGGVPESERLVGDLPVRLATEGRETAGLVYCNLHENERTSVAAARAVLGECAGRLFMLRAQGRRLITFTLDGQTYTFDPNRIFSLLGIERTLRLYGRSSERARAAVGALAAWWLEQTGLARASLVVALHNNGPGAYSIRSYAGHGAEHRMAAAVYENGRGQPDDFLLVTERRFFDHLRSRGFNVVQQVNATAATDDGSLAVYCGRARIPYVNVEAAFGHFNEQVAMLREVHRMLGPACAGPARR